jgi:hypothetical protein
MIQNMDKTLRRLLILGGSIIAFVLFLFGLIFFNLVQGHIA